MGKIRMAAWAGFGALLALWACRSDRDFGNPYLPGDPDYQGDEWTRDGDGDGIADSVEKYLPDCKLAPKRCLQNAKILSAIPPDQYALAARNMLLWVDDTARSPDLEWNPPEAALRGYSLSTSDSSIARVRDGKIAPVAAGSAQIDVTVPGMRALGASFIVKVAAQGRRVDSARVPDLAVAVGKDTVPPVVWYPADAAFKEYALASDKPAVAAVSGRSVRGVAAGTAHLTLTTLDGSRQSVFAVSVSDRVRVRALSADPLYLVKGAAPAAPSLVWTPANAADKRYRIVPLESGPVASVSGDSSKVIPNAVGQTQMLAVSADGGLSAEFTVNVSAAAVPVAGIEAQDLNLALGGDPQPPHLIWSPANATDRRYALATADSTVAVPSAGLIRPTGMGAADFQVTALDGGFTAAFKVIVGPPDTTVHVDSVHVEPFSLAVGKLQSVAPVWYPSNAGNQGFSLTTADTGIIGIRDASVAGRRAGTADVRLTTVDGGRVADFKVNVYAPVVPVQQVSVDPLTVYVGGDGALTITWTPANATDLGYTLVSQDTNVAAIVDRPGGARVRGKAVGATTVTLLTSGGQTASFTVTVVAAPIHVISVSAPNLVLGVGDTAKPVAVAFNPANATDKSFTLSAPANGPVSVSGNKVTALKQGKADLTVTPNDNPSAAVVCTVTVVSRTRSLSAKDDTLRVGAGDKPVAGDLTWDPPDATDKSFDLKSNDTNIVRIAASGTAYRGLSGGRTTVIVRALDGSGKADTFNVLVQVPVSQISAADVTLKAGIDTAYNPWFLFSWQPANASNKGWYLTFPFPGASPSPSTIVSLPNTWQLRALNPGTAKVTVNSADNPAAKDTFTVTVIRPVSGIGASNVNMRVGDADLPAPVTLSPSDASDKNYTLASSNTSVATAVPGNKIHAVSGGTATFTATSASDPSKSATFTVTVAIPVISVSAADLTVRIGEGDKPPTLTWNPSNATNKGYSLASQNTSLLTIVANQLHGVAPGTATATVTSADGGKSATFTVTVIQPVVSVSAANIAMRRGDPNRDPALTWNPANASNKGYTLSGGNASVATVVNNAIHAVGAGSAGMTVTSSDGSKTANFTVTVTNPVTAIDGGPDITIRSGEPDAEVPAVISPADASNKAWHMVSEDPNIASVNGHYVHPVSRGDVNVIVISDDNAAVSDTVLVSVRGLFGL